MRLPPFAVVVLVAGVGFAAPAAAATTAMLAMAQAQSAAAKWRPDASLTSVATLRGRADGQAASWLYTYYSAAAKRSAIVTARGTRIEINADVRNTAVIPLGTAFLDSGQAAAMASKAGLDLAKGGDSLGLALTAGDQALGKPRTFWSVTVMRDDGFSAVTLDGKTGALIKRDDVKF